jgi:hypothetical protein
LTFGADPPPAPGLVPRYGNVDEALEEVALLGLGGTPSVLELLMSGEELTAANQIEAARQFFRLRP